MDINHFIYRLYIDINFIYRYNYFIGPILLTFYPKEKE